MSVDGFIEAPSFRPDGRLDRLHHGGGSKLPKTIPGEPAKVQRQPDFVRMLMLAAHQKPGESKKLDPAAGYTIPYGQGKLGPMLKPKGGPTPPARKQQGSAVALAGGGAGGTDAAGISTQMGTTESAADVAVTPKRRRTLLSGGGRVFEQPYGNDTVLGG